MDSRGYQMKRKEILFEAEKNPVFLYKKAELFLEHKKDSS